MNASPRQPPLQGVPPMVKQKACKWHEETECSLQKGEATKNFSILAKV